VGAGEGIGEGKGVSVLDDSLSGNVEVGKGGAHSGEEEAVACGTRNQENSYEFYGTAGDEKDAESVARYFGRCLEVVRALPGGQIDERRMIVPPGEKIELHR